MPLNSLRWPKLPLRYSDADAAPQFPTWHNVSYYNKTRSFNQWRPTLYPNFLTILFNAVSFKVMFHDLHVLHVKQSQMRLCNKEKKHLLLCAIIFVQVTLLSSRNDSWGIPHQNRHLGILHSLGVFWNSVRFSLNVKRDEFVPQRCSASPFTNSLFAPDRWNE